MQAEVIVTGEFGGRLIKRNQLGEGNAMLWMVQQFGIELNSPAQRISVDAVAGSKVKDLPARAGLNRANSLHSWLHCGCSGRASRVPRSVNIRWRRPSICCRPESVAF